MSATGCPICGFSGRLVPNWRIWRWAVAKRIGRVRTLVADPAVAFLLIVAAGLVAVAVWALVWRFSGPAVSGDLITRPMFGHSG